MPSNKAARSIAPGWRRIAVAGVVALMAGLPIPGPAEAREPSLEQTLRDIRLTICARKMLYEDPILGPLNLGVRVESRVAVLWGPVPAVEIGWQAEERLRGMIELAEIRNEMLVQADNDFLRQAPRPLEGPRVLPELLPPVLPGRPASPLMPRLKLGNPTELVRR